MSKSVNKTTKSRRYGFEKRNKMSESKRRGEKENRSGYRDKYREEGEGEGEGEDENEAEKEVEQNHLPQFRCDNLTKFVMYSVTVFLAIL